MITMAKPKGINLVWETNQCIPKKSPLDLSARIGIIQINMIKELQGLNFKIQNQNGKEIQTQKVIEREEFHNKTFYPNKWSLMSKDGLCHHHFQTPNSTM